MESVSILFALIRLVWPPALLFVALVVTLLSPLSLSEEEIQKWQRCDAHGACEEGKRNTFTATN